MIIYKIINYLLINIKLTINKPMTISIIIIRILDNRAPKNIPNLLYFADINATKKKVFLKFLKKL